MTARRGVSSFALQSIILVIWSWTSGFVLASLSGRTLWVTAAVFFSEIGVLLSVLVFHVFSPKPTLIFGVSLVLFLLPSAIGVRRGLRPDPLGLHRAFLAGAALALSLVALTEYVGAWAYTWPRSALLCWPTAYLLVTEYQRRDPSETAPS